MRQLIPFFKLYLCLDMKLRLVSVVKEMATTPVVPHLRFAAIHFTNALVSKPPNMLIFLSSYVPGDAGLDGD